MQQWKAQEHRRGISVPGWQHWCFSISRGFATFCCSHGQTLHHQLGEGSREALPHHIHCDGENESNSWDFCTWPIHREQSSAITPQLGLALVSAAHCQLLHCLPPHMVQDFRFNQDALPPMQVSGKGCAWEVFRTAVAQLANVQFVPHCFT